MTPASAPRTLGTRSKATSLIELMVRVGQITVRRGVIIWDRGVTTATDNSQSATCASCHLTTTMPRLLVRSPRSFRIVEDRTRLICPRCRSERLLAIYLVNFGIGMVSAVLLLACWLFGQPRGRQDDDLLQLAAILAAVTLAQVVMVIIHESAHAIVGSLVGLRVFGISIGVGPRIWRHQFGNFFVNINSLPAGGFCAVAPKPESTTRWPIALMIAAGPMVHLLAILALVYVARNGTYASSSESQSACWEGLFIVNAMCLIANALPRNVRIGGERGRPNDGKLLFRLLRSNGNVKPWITLCYLREIGNCLETGRANEARRWLTDAQKAGYESVAFRIMELSVLALERNWKQVRESARNWMSIYSKPLEQEPLAAWAAVSIVYLGGSLADAEAFCNVTMSVIPWDPAAQTVRALVFLAQGKLHEAEVFISRARSGHPQWAAEAAGAHIWAELYRCKGDITKQRKWEARAKTLDPIGAFTLNRLGAPGSVTS
jgi:hypothetical protein